MPAFHHHDLCLLNPAFDSPLVDVVTGLEHLRRLQLGGSLARIERSRWPRRELVKIPLIGDIRNSRIANITISWNSNPKICWCC